MMGDWREERVRWKGKNASAVARADPLSALYDTMKEWTAPFGLLVGTAVLLRVGLQQADILNRASFGRPYPASAAQPSLLLAPSYPPPIPEGTEIFQLGLEEAFFLSYHLKCIDVYSENAQGKVKLNQEELWTQIVRTNPQFLQFYVAYSDLRLKRWVVLSGIQFGADLMAYRHHPALVHSDYAVLVMSGEKEQRLSTWTDIHAMQRLCGSVAKTLLLLYVTTNAAAIGQKFPTCLEHCTVEAVEVERWIPEKHREACISIETLT